MMMYEDVYQLIMQFVGNNFVHRNKYKLIYSACMRQLRYVAIRKHFILYRHFKANRSFHVVRIVFNDTLDAYGLLHTIYYHPAHDSDASDEL